MQEFKIILKQFWILNLLIIIKDKIIGILKSKNQKAV